MSAPRVDPALPDGGSRHYRPSLSDAADESIIKEMAEEIGAPAGLDYATVRPRVLDDLAACEALARNVHRRDRYPIVLQDDVREFLAPRLQLAAWIAEHRSIVVGHVALHLPTSPAMTTAVREATGARPSGVGVVSRLMVAPDTRGHRLGRRLLAVARDEARRRGLLPALDVITSYAAAIALYETEGWQRVGRIAIPMPSGQLIDEYVYVAPSSCSDESRRSRTRRLGGIRARLSDIGGGILGDVDVGYVRVRRPLGRGPVPPSDGYLSQAGTAGRPDADEAAPQRGRA